MTATEVGKVLGCLRATVSRYLATHDDDAVVPEGSLP